LPAATPPAAPTAPRRVHVGRILVLLLLLVLAAILTAYLDTRIERIVLALSRDRAGGSIRIGDMRSRLALTRLVFRDVRWLGPGGEELLFAREVRVNYGLLSLLRRGLILDRLEIRGARAALVRDSGGEWIIVRALAALGAGEPGRPTPVVVDVLALEDATIRVRDVPRRLAITLEGISSRTALRLPRLALTTRTQARGGSFERAGERVKLGPLRLAAHMAGGPAPEGAGRQRSERNALVVDGARLAVGGSALRFRGALADPAALDGLDGHLAGDIDTRDLEALRPTGRHLRGTLAIEAKVRGSLARPHAAGVARAGEAAVGDLRIHGLEARFDFLPPALRVPSLALSAFGGKLEGSARIDTEMAGYLVDLRCRGISGRRLVDYVLPGPLFEHVRERVAMRAEQGIYEDLEGTLRAEGRGFAPVSLEGSAALRFASPERPAEAVPFLLDARLRAGGGKVVVERLHLDSADLRVRVGPGTEPAAAESRARTASRLQSSIGHQTRR
jgi:hypothetical protein